MLSTFPLKVKSAEGHGPARQRWVGPGWQAGERLTRDLFLAVFLLVATLLWPSQALATVCATMDRSGAIHYVPARNSHPRQTACSARRPRPQSLSGRSSASAKATALWADDHPAARSLQDSIESVATEHGVDPLLVKAVIKTESNFDPEAVSAKGALGLMQLMPATARELRVANPLENVTGGTRYLRTLLDSYDGNVALSLAAYNAGPGRVKDAIPNIPETRTYVARVLRHYASYRKAR